MTNIFKWKISQSDDDIDSLGTDFLGDSSCPPTLAELTEPKIFGVELTEPILPTFLRNSFKYIQGHPKSGIFRVCSSKQRRQKLRDRVNKRKEIDYGKTEVDLLAALVKAYYREYPRSLFSKQLLSKCAVGMQPMSVVRSNLKKGLSVGSIEYMLLKSLFFCCVKVDSDKEITMMDSKSLAIIMAPNLFKDLCYFKKSGIRMIEILIEEYEYIFGDKAVEKRKSMDGCEKNLEEMKKNVEGKLHTRSKTSSELTLMEDMINKSNETKKRIAESVVDHSRRFKLLNKVVSKVVDADKQNNRKTLAQDVAEKFKIGDIAKEDILKARIEKLERELKRAQTKISEAEHKGMGWLLKGTKSRIGSKLSWKWRYFVCDWQKREFSYYTEPLEGIKPIKTIKIGDYFHITADDDMKVTKKPHSFLLITPSRTWYFVAANEEEKNRWLEYWNKALLNVKTNYREGFLKKKSQETKGWKMRFFRFDMKVTKMKMTYFYNQSDSIPIREVDIKHYKYVDKPGLVFQLVPKKIKTGFDRVWEMKCMTPDDKSLWFRFFRKNLF